MSSETAPEKPLTDEDRRLVEGLIEARARIAKLFTLLSAGGLALFLLRVWGSSARSRNTAGLLVVAAVVTLVVGAIVFAFGWRPLSLMREDLRRGVRRRLRGEIRQIDRVDNAYGETITTVWLDSQRLTTRTAMFAGMEKGRTVTVEYLPGSGVALSASSGEGPSR